MDQVLVTGEEWRVLQDYKKTAPYVLMKLMPTTPQTSASGARLRELRSERGFSQEAFAHHPGIDRIYVSGLEGGVRNPTVTMVAKLALALDVAPADLMATVPAWADGQDAESK